MVTKDSRTRRRALLMFIGCDVLL